MAKATKKAKATKVLEIKSAAPADLAAAPAIEPEPAKSEAPGGDTPTSAPAEPEREAPKQQFSIALSKPGEDVPDGGRRFGCPDCGAKHDVVKADAVAGQGGTWTVPDFKCLAPCGYAAATQPIV